VSKRPTTKSTRLSRKLKQIRITLGLSQSELLDRLGFSESLFRSNISQYERGARVPSPKVLLHYSRVAEVDLAVLIDDDMDLPPRFTSHRKVPRKR
jgi:transcriptional regulator with XRE-family HTH domain